MTKSSATTSSFFTRQHDTLYKLPSLEILEQVWPLEADYQMELLNVLYYLTPDEVEFQYTLAASFSKISGMKNKSLGFHSGWPDVTAVWPYKSVEFLELKAAKGKLSPAQIECHAFLKELGFDVLVCKTIKDAVLFLVARGMPLKPEIRLDVIFDSLPNHV